MAVTNFRPDNFDGACRSIGLNASRSFLYDASRERCTRFIHSSTREFILPSAISRDYRLASRNRPLDPLRKSEMQRNAPASLFVRSLKRRGSFSINVIFHLAMNNLFSAFPFLLRLFLPFDRFLFRVSLTCRNTEAICSLITPAGCVRQAHMSVVPCNRMPRTATANSAVCIRAHE